MKQSTAMLAAAALSVTLALDQPSLRATDPVVNGASYAASRTH